MAASELAAKIVSTYISIRFTWDVDTVFEAHFSTPLLRLTDQQQGLD